MTEEILARFDGPVSLLIQDKTLLEMKISKYVVMLLMVRVRMMLLRVRVRIFYNGKIKVIKNE